MATSYPSPSPQKQVRNLLILIFSAITAGLLFSSLLLYQYGPTGQYTAGNVLVAPSLLPGLAFQDEHPQKGGKARFIFDGLIFSYYNEKMGRWLKEEVSQEDYDQFYSLIAQEKSLIDLDQEVVRYFNQGELPSLIFVVRTDGTANTANKVFQQIQFVPELDYFRIQLHNQQQWAYFRYRGIYAKALSMFANTP